MSKQSYINGFCKAAAQRNVDPCALARFTPVKQAQAGLDMWKKVMEFLDKAKASAKGAYGDIKAKYNGLTPSKKAIINTVGGTLAGGTIGGLVGGKKGLLAGSAIGGTAGAASSVDWKAIADAIKSYKKAPKKTESAAAETK